MDELLTKSAEDTCQSKPSGSVSLSIATQNYLNCLQLVAEEYPECDLDHLITQLHDPRRLGLARIPISLVTDNINTISRHLDEPMLGIKVTRRVRFSNLPIVRLLKTQLPPEINPGNLGELIIFLANFFATLTEAIDIKLTWRRGVMHMRVSACSPALSRHQLEGAMLGISELLFHITGFTPEVVGFKHACVSDMDEYKRYFRSELNFEADENVLSFRATQRFTGMDDRAINTVAGLSLLLHESFPTLSLRERCRRILRSILHFGEPSRARVASVLGLSISTLQRYLRAEGTSFKAELLLLRKELALEYLLVQGLSACDTAFLLGYQSESQFFKAFKLWFDMTPGQIKRVGKAEENLSPNLVKSLVKNAPSSAGIKKALLSME